MRWQEDARCLGMDTNIFFPQGPEKGKRHPKSYAAEAKAICSECSVIFQCQDWALANPVQGVWGGTTDQERIDLRRQLGIPLPSGHEGREPKWLRDYNDLIASGWTQMQIWRSKGVQMEAFLRQLRVYGIPKSPELERYLAERQWASA